MHSKPLPRLTFALVVAFSLAEMSAAQRPMRSPFAYELPIEKAGCGGFFFDNGSMYLFEYEGRQLYEISRGGKLIPREDVKGWYVVDAAIVNKRPVYCSRNRVFSKNRGKIEVTPINNSEKLVSIATDGEEAFLLDAAERPTIIVLDGRTGAERRRLSYSGRRPIDLVEHDGHLWVLDQGDRCVHRVNKRTGKTTLRFQAGPGVERWTHGLLVREGDLYVHEGDYARLRRIDWSQDDATVRSWSYPLRMTFIQESWNDHEKNATAVQFKVPIPPTRSTQTVGQPEWSQPPTRVVEDRFGQQVGLFEKIQIPPGGKHVLKYTIDVEPRALQYDPPNVPLSALDRVDSNIRSMYLASNKLYQMDDKTVKDAAQKARKDRQGREPKDVRSLIENIAAYIIDNLSYQLDDSWKDAATVLKSKTGSCSEYSFLFSALCRLNKVPTRLVGGIQIDDYVKPHETKGFHRWTEVWFPEIGWIPVDVTKIDGEMGSLDYEFLFGTPGYLLVLFEGDIDEAVMNTSYYIWRNYRGGTRRRNNVVRIEPAADPNEHQVVKLWK